MTNLVRKHLKIQLENLQRLQTLVFHYRKNGHYNAAVTIEAFGDIFCDWTGTVSNGYILNSHSVKSM